MDQNFEAVLSMAIFVLIFSTANYVCTATYASAIATKLDCTLSHYASIAGDVMILNGSNNYDGWNSFAPSPNASLYGLPHTIMLWVNATCFSMSGSCEPITLWTRSTSQPPVFRTGECTKLVEIGEGKVIVITVRAW